MNIKINSLVGNQTNQKANVATKADKKTADASLVNKNTKPESLNENIKLSQKAKDISQKSQTIDKAKVAQLKEAILDGSYKVDGKEVAKNIFNFERLFGI